jgi:hypothetical protein
MSFLSSSLPSSFTGRQVSNDHANYDDTQVPFPLPPSLPSSSLPPSLFVFLKPLQAKGSRMKEGGRQGGREGGKEGGREGGREDGRVVCASVDPGMCMCV